MNRPFISKEVSWLSFNARVLQEVADPQVPLLERVRFLGIFSSNQDEFFRVRVATLRRLLKIRKKAIQIIGHDPKVVLEQVQKIVLRQGREFDRLYGELLAALAAEGIVFHDGSGLTEEQTAYLHGFFQREVRPLLVPLLLTPASRPSVHDHENYLAVEMTVATAADPAAAQYALIRIPSDLISRFIQLPGPAGEGHIILLDDLIRLCLPRIFASFPHDRFRAYAFKVTRDSELDLDDELFKSFPQKVQDSLKKRRTGTPVRFVHDRDMPATMQKLLRKRLGILDDGACIPGGRYHNFKDFIEFPRLFRRRFTWAPLEPVPHAGLAAAPSLFAAIGQRDVLLHFPYHSFDHFVDLLREAAIDPAVDSIRLTAYRLARQSHIVNALTNAVQNGKKVFVVVELQARFDEEANLQWSALMREDGVRVVHGVPGLKVHAKMCLITRREKNGKRLRYACIGTGNFNEATARLYTDHMLLTADPRITREVHQVFEFFENTYRIPAFRHLLVSPFQTRDRLKKLIRNEIAAAKKGREAWIDIKINNLADADTVRLLYDASAAGVRVRVICRSMFSLVPGLRGVSENIEAISIVGRFLEHSRFFIFAGGGKPVTLISSADWLPRNFDRRVELACPIYDPDLQRQLREYFDLQWRDTVKARRWDSDMSNCYRTPEGKAVNSQEALAAWVRRLPAETGETA